MRIGIDARLLDSERTGIASYTAHLVQSLAGLEGGEKFVLFTDRTVAVPGPNFSNVVIPTKRRVLWSFLRLPARLRREEIDLWIEEQKQNTPRTTNTMSRKVED